MPPAELTSDVLLADPAALTRALVDIESVSGDEKEITDAVEQALRPRPHLAVERVGNVVRARTELGSARGPSWPATWTRCRCTRIFPPLWTATSCMAAARRT